MKTEKYQAWLESEIDRLEAMIIEKTETIARLAKQLNDLRKTKKAISVKPPVERPIEGATKQ